MKNMLKSFQPKTKLQRVIGINSIRNCLPNISFL